MSLPTPTKMILTGAASAALLTAGVMPAQATPAEHLNTVETYSFEGQFQCGDLVLTSTGGTFTERIEGTLSNGVIHVGIHRTYHDLTFVGSDGVEYRATATANERAVLLATDMENPIWAHEVNQTTFQGGPGGSPGYVHEDLRIDNGHETDVVTGGCAFGAE
jgi:hypothetical protein